MGSLVAAPLVGSLAVAANAADPVVVLAEDFDDGTTGDWQRSGGPTLGFVPGEGGGQALEVAGRAADYDGIKSPAVAYEAGVTYSFSMRARLAEGTAGTADIRFVTDPSYTWIGDTTIDAAGWTTVAGTFTPESDTSRQVFLGTSALTGSAAPYTYLVDDVRVTRPAPAEEPGTAVLTSDFESGTAPWVARGAGVTVTRTTDAAHGGAASMLVAGRSANWHGAQTPINGLLAPEGTYTVSAWVRLAPGEADTTVKLSVAEQPEAFVQVTNPATVTDDAWVQLAGTYTRGAAVTGGDLYVEAAGATTSLLVDDVVVTGTPAGGGDGWEPTPDPGFVPGGAENPTTTPVSAARGTGDVAALTFDDGPNGDDTADLLDFLAANDLPATFCVIGENVQAPGGAELLRRIVDEGHTLCNHTTGYTPLDSAPLAAVEADLKENLRIIRAALGDPDAPVPYYRAPNGAWGRTPEVAVALGMQPLAVVNTISDWETQDEDVLAANLRVAMKPGQVVLVHDGGGDRAASVAATRTVVTERLADGWTFTLPVGGVPAEAGTALIAADFEDGTLQGWSARADGAGSPTVEVVAGGHDSTRAARVSGRTSQGQGLQFPVDGLLVPGTTYELEAWVKFEGEPGDMALSYRSETGGTSTYNSLVPLTGLTTDWTRVGGTFTVPANTREIYFETAYDGGAAGNTSTFLLDDIAVRVPPEPEIQDLTPLRSTVDFPLGVAVDQRETAGAPAELTTRHFNQLTPENQMKPYAWYDAQRQFRTDPQADAIMRFAQEQDLRVYGHVLVWHSQNPGQAQGDATGWTSWFFQDDAGNPLPTDGSARELMLERMRDHIFAVAETLADEYGAFGSETNPIVAWDVINEVVSDTGEFEDGLRRSAWYQIVGPDFIDKSFEYADEAFNDVYAAPGTDRPVKLFINDYNTEQSGKQQRYLDLVERLVAADVPIDGVGHQMHVSLATPVSALDGALDRFADLGLLQAVTELDVTTGLPVTDAKIIDQGYYYRDAFEVFRDHADELFSVTVWGLTDPRSWRSEQDPLLFDGGLQAKPAYYGAAGGALPPPVRTATAFAGDVPLTDDATSALAWAQLPLLPVGETGGFQLRWAPDHLSVYVEVADGTPQAADGVEVQLGDETYRFPRAGEGDVEGVVTEVEGGYAVVVHVPADGLAEGSTVQLDVRTTDGGTTSGWNADGRLGSVSLVEELSYLEVARAAAAPEVDGAVDDVWADAGTVTTGKVVSGTAGATAQVRTLWRDDRLYVLADVTDPSVDVTASSPWEQDSVEVFVDAGNHKNGSFRPEDTQIRISAANSVSFGTGDEASQRARVETAVEPTATGYRVELSVDLLDESGLGTFHGLDFQVNDATAGARTGIVTWADPTGGGYQTTTRWGVGRLVDTTGGPGGPGEPGDGQPSITVSSPQVRAGGQVDVRLAGFEAGQRVAVSLGAGATARAGAAVAVPAGSTALGTVTIGADGTATLRVTVPAGTTPGVYVVEASADGAVLASTTLTVLAAAAGAPGATGAGGGLAVTGAGLALGVLALLVLAAGVALVVARRRGLLTRP